jgi:protein-tyrosine-phosphatase/DNA-binding transcriptional ArsR family regulator
MGVVDAGPPPFVALLSHPVRWRLVTELARSDLRVRELVALVGEPQSLVSYHLRLLRDGGLVASRRSSFDARDSYYHLDLDQCAEALAATGTALHPALNPALSTARTPRQHEPARTRVLFVCTGNSSRSPMAEALLRRHTGGRVRVSSAGTHPKERIHPHAVRVLRERYDIDIDGQRTRSVEEGSGRRFDRVITLCDKAREDLTDREDWPRAHWSVADPAVTGGYGSFLAAAADIDARVRHLVPSLGTTTKEDQP